jgi:hypothetical protein
MDDFLETNASLAVGVDRAFGNCCQVSGVYFGRILPILHGKPVQPVVLFVAGECHCKVMVLSGPPER